MSTPVPSKNGATPRKRFRPQRALRYQWLKLLRLRGDPSSIARGVAIGVFIGITPTIPFHTVLVVFFCTMLRGNIISAIALNWIVSNPVTIPLEYYFSWKIGTLIFGPSLGSWKDVHGFLLALKHVSIVEAVRLLAEKGILFVGSLVLGGCIIAMPFAICSYVLYLRWHIYRQKRRYHRFLAKKTKEELP